MDAKSSKGLRAQHFEFGCDSGPPPKSVAASDYDTKEQKSAKQATEERGALEKIKKDLRATHLALAPRANARFEGSSVCRDAFQAPSAADLGLALHGVQDPDDTALNLGKGRTVITITDGNAFRSRIYESAGRGIPDRTRMSINAVELVRMALTEGFG